jgi:predicted PurR-regulated permease PerM
MRVEQILRHIRMILVIVTLIVTMWVASRVFQPVALAILFAFILAPLVRWLERVRLPRPLAILAAMLLTFAGLGGLSYVVGSQLAALAGQAERYEASIKAKIQALRGVGQNPFEKATEVAERVQRSIEPVKEVPEVRVVEVTSWSDRMREALSPWAEVGETVFVVLLMLFFLLLERETIGERIVKLVGRGQISVTAKTMTQIAERLSKYLSSFTLVNIAVGVVVGVGLAAIGLPYAVLWGAIGGLLRYIPYVGPTLAFSLPVLFSFAHFDNLLQPMLVLVFYLMIEAVTTAFEPALYGKRTGISPLGMLIAALFWTWLWGPLGLLMSTPLTVCLVSVGRYVPGLGFLSTVLSEEVEIPDDLRLYQRLLHRDHDGAVALLDGALERMPAERVFDTVIVPALARAAEDHRQGVLDPDDLASLRDVLGDWLDDLEDNAAVLQSLPAPSAAPEEGMAALEAIEAEPSAAPRRLVALATGPNDPLVLRMLNLLLRPARFAAEEVEAVGPALKVSEQVAGKEPSLLLMSHLPPIGLTHARYLINRLRARLPDVPLIVGHWDPTLDVARAAERLGSTGGFRVAVSLASARDMLFDQVLGRGPESAEPLAPTPAASTA